MRKIWFANCMVAVAALGCTSTKSPSSMGGLTSTGGAPGAPGAVVTAEPTGWTDKFVASVKGYTPDVFGSKKPLKAAPVVSTDRNACADDDATAPASRAKAMPTTIKNRWSDDTQPP